MKRTIRVDTTYMREHMLTHDRLRFEDWLQRLVEEGWELLQVVQLSTGYILTVHRSVARRWWSR